MELLDVVARKVGTTTGTVLEGIKVMDGINVMDGIRVAVIKGVWVAVWDASGVGVVLGSWVGVREGVVVKVGVRVGATAVRVGTEVGTSTVEVAGDIICPSTTARVTAPKTSPMEIRPNHRPRKNLLESFINYLSV
jgi:hypothetical protein